MNYTATLLSDNLFIGNPNNIFNSSIQVLITAVDFSANDFTGPIPTNVFSLPRLESFGASKTCFSGSLPTAICGCTTLKVLLMDGVTSGPSCQLKFDFIQTLDAYVSRLFMRSSGSCPNTFLGLKSLYLGNNSFSFLNTSTFGETLEILTMSNNSLVSSFPSDLGAVQVLAIDENGFVGVIDLNCSKPIALTKLFAGNNQLSGNLSRCSCMQNLNMLRVSYNSFTGSLDFVSSLSKIEELIVAGNLLTGTRWLF